MYNEVIGCGYWLVDSDWSGGQPTAASRFWPCTRSCRQLSGILAVKYNAPALKYYPNRFCLSHVFNSCV